MGLSMVPEPDGHVARLRSSRLPALTQSPKSVSGACDYGKLLALLVQKQNL